MTRDDAITKIRNLLAAQGWRNMEIHIRVDDRSNPHEPFVLSAEGLHKRKRVEMNASGIDPHTLVEKTKRALGMK